LRAKAFGTGLGGAKNAVVAEAVRRLMDMAERELMESARED